jgi:hypothetical protein
MTRAIDVTFVYPDVYVPFLLAAVDVRPREGTAVVEQSAAGKSSRPPLVSCPSSRLELERLTKARWSTRVAA